MAEDSKVLLGNDDNEGNTNPDIIVNDEPIVIPEDLRTDAFKQYGTQFGATKVDEAGNFLNDKGEVVKKWNDIETLISEEGEIIELDGNKYKLDENGNALDNEGKIFKTKEEVAELSTPIPNLLGKKTGYEVKDEQGNVITFPDNIEGLEAREKQIIENVRKASYNTAVNEFLNANPFLIDAIRHYKEKGSYKGLGETEDYSKITLDKEEIDTHMAYIIKAEMMRGNTEERAKQLAAYIKNDNRTYEEATLALKYMNEKTELSRKEYNDKIVAQQKAAQDAIEEDTNNIVKVIKDGKIGDFVIPDKLIKTENGKSVEYSKAHLIEYMTVPKYQDRQGNQFTAYEVDKMEFEKNNDNIVLDALRLFMGKDIKTIFKENVQQTHVSNLKERINKFKSGSSGSRQTLDSSSSKVILG